MKYCLRGAMHSNWWFYVVLSMLISLPQSSDIILLKAQFMIETV